MSGVVREVEVQAIIECGRLLVEIRVTLDDEVLALKATPDDADELAGVLIATAREARAAAS